MSSLLLSTRWGIQHTRASQWSALSIPVGQRYRVLCTLQSRCLAARAMSAAAPDTRVFVRSGKARPG